jgi:hypothetical protein
MQKLGFILLALALIIGIGVKVSQTSKTGGDTAQTSGTNGTPGANGNGSEAGTNGQTANGVAGANGNADHSVTGANGVAGNGGNGTVAGNGAGVAANHAVDANGKPIVEAKPVKQNDCFAYEYHHTEAAAGKDIEDYLDYTNAFAVEHGPVNAKSVCVKVNQKPVKFKITQYKGQQEIQIGSVVGPESVIRVSYCVGQAPCKEACAVKANRFMDDLTADNDEQDSFKESWDAGNKNKKELEANAKEMRSIASKSDAIANQSVIREWETLKKQEWVCTK